MYPKPALSRGRLGGAPGGAPSGDPTGIEPPGGPPGGGPGGGLEVTVRGGWENAGRVKRRPEVRRERAALAALPQRKTLYPRQERLRRVGPYLVSSKPGGPCLSHGRHDPPEPPAWRGRRGVEIECRRGKGSECECRGRGRDGTVKVE